MKVNQIVGEHKKGVKARIYARKGPEPRKPFKPEVKQDAEKTMEDVDVTMKPLPGAQEVDINGKPVGTATTPQAAAAISDLAKKGEFTPVTDQPTSEGLFGTSEEELAKDPGPAGDYYRKLAALKTDPRWASKQDIVQKRIQDLINRIDLDKGIPQPAAGKPAGPETDPAKFQQMNPSFKEAQFTPDQVKGFQDQLASNRATANDIVAGKLPAQSTPGKMTGPERAASIAKTFGAKPNKDMPATEAHKDTIAQGGGNVGGDATDRFIDQVRDKKFTNAQRKGTGQRSPLGENDELYKWLTIAGLK